MKNRMLILMICLLSSLSSFAQTPNWAWWDDYDGEVISSLIQDQYVYVVGNFHDSVLQIGSSNLTPKGSLDIYLAKWDTNGNFVWAVTISDSGFQWSTNLHLNANNELVVGGNNMNSNLILGNDTIYNQGLNNQVGFIVKFDTSGNLLDAFQSEVVIDMCVDSSNAVYVTTGTKILKYSPAGILIWQEPFQAKYISYSESGSCLLVSAEFYNTLTIGSYSITAVSSQTYGPTSDICCYKIDLNGNPNWLINVTGTIRGELLLRPYLNKQTNELFLAYDRLGLSGSYVNIGKVDLSGMLSILPIGNTVPNLSIPLDFLDNPWIEIATGKDSFVVFYLISNMSSKVYFFNVMTQLTSSSLDIQPEQILYDGPNSIYMGELHLMRNIPLGNWVRSFQVYLRLGHFIIVQGPRELL